MKSKGNTLLDVSCPLSSVHYVLFHLTTTPLQTTYYHPLSLFIVFSSYFAYSSLPKNLTLESHYPPPQKPSSLLHSSLLSLPHSFTHHSQTFLTPSLTTSYIFSLLPVRTDCGSVPDTEGQRTIQDCEP